jgi:hypothetical protein
MTNRTSRFDLLTKRAVEELHVPISTLTILDPQKEHYKSSQGLNEKDGERAISFCGHALLMKDLFVIPDTSQRSKICEQSNGNRQTIHKIIYGHGLV